MLVGLSPNRLSMANTLIASLIVGALGVLVAPVIAARPASLPLAVVPALDRRAVRQLHLVLDRLRGRAGDRRWPQNILYYASTQSWFPTDHGDRPAGRRSSCSSSCSWCIALFLRGASLPRRGEHVEKRLPLVPRPERLLRPAVLALIAGGVALIVLPFDFRQALMNT